MITIYPQLQLFILALSRPLFAKNLLEQTEINSLEVVFKDGQLYNQFWSYVVTENDFDGSTE